MQATGGLFKNITISESAVARDLSLSGFKAGNIVLRKFDDITINFSETHNIYSQICGTGQVRIKFNYQATYQGYFPDRVFVYVEDILKDTLQITKEDTELKTYTIDVDIIEGQYINLKFVSGGSVSVSGTNSNITNIELLTDGANGILAYLGAVSASSSVHPVR